MVVLGHRTFPLSTGGVIPVLVKAEKQQQQQSQTSETLEAFTPACTCATPPAAKQSEACTTVTAPGKVPVYPTAVPGR